MKKWLIVVLFLSLILFVYAGDYGVGDYGTGEFNIGEVTPDTGGDEGGSGGGAGCTYDWVCTDWFPSECTVDGYQQRLCINKGTCTGTVGIPITNRSCTYEPEEPLFDIFVKIPDNYKSICPGENVKLDIQLKNYGKQELLDAFMTYWIMDNNNNLVAELKDTRSVISTLDFDVSMKIPDASTEGTYRLYAQINYAINKTALAGESFEVNTDSCKLSTKFRDYLPQIIFGFIIAIIFISIMILIISIFRTLKYIKKNRKANISSYY